MRLRLRAHLCARERESVCVHVCVYVCERERDRERNKEKERETKKQRRERRRYIQIRQMGLLTTGKRANEAKRPTHRYKRITGAGSHRYEDREKEEQRKRPHT